MNKEELIAYLEASAGDFTFEAYGQWYFISEDKQEDVCRYSCGVADSYDSIEFDTLNEALNGFSINGKPLIEVLPHISW